MTAAERQLLRHMLATLAYRGGKVLRGAPAGFGEFRVEGLRNTPGMLLAHVNDLVEWAHRWCEGPTEYRVSQPGAWDAEVARFHASLAAFDALLAAERPIEAPLAVIFQAPVADALTHVGQLALLRRLAGAPVLGEAYRLAEIEAGRLGPEQAAPGREFPLDEGALWRKPA